MKWLFFVAGCLLAASASAQDVRSDSGISAPVSVLQGGTAATTFAAHGSLTGEGTGPVVSVPGGANCLLYWSSASVDPTCAVTISIANISGTTISASTGYRLNTSMLISATAPSAVTNAGTGAVITSENGSAKFSIVATTGTTSAWTITMPTAINDWACWANNRTTHSANQTMVQQTNATSSNNSVVMTFYNDVTVATAPTVGDRVEFHCFSS